MVAVSAGAAPVARILKAASGQERAGLPIGRKRHGSLERLNRDGSFQIFPPQQKLLLVRQRATPALIEDDFFQESVAAITSKRLFGALLLDRVAKLVEMG